MEASYEVILDNNAANEWNTIIFKYVPSIVSETTVNYEGIFSEETIEMQTAMQKLTNAMSDIMLLTDE